MQETVSESYIENKIAIATEGFDFENQTNQIRNLSSRENALSIAKFLIECKNEGVGILTRVSYTFTLCNSQNMLKNHLLSLVETISYLI